MKKAKNDPSLKLKPRPSESLMLNVPTDVIESLRQIALTRDMSVEALLKFYVGQGLRQDLARIYADRVLAQTEQVLTRHRISKDKVTEIMQEIRETGASYHIGQ